MSAWLTDLWHASRALPTRAAGNATIVVVLALGVGLSSAIFAFADPFVFRALPYGDPARLVAISAVTRDLTRDVEIPTVEDWRQRTELFQDVAAWRRGGLTRVRLADGAAALQMIEVTGNFFAVLGVPGLERLRWDASGSSGVPVALTAAGVRRLPSSSTAFGRVLERRDQIPLRVTAVLPRDFVMPDPREARVDGLLRFEPGPVVEVQQWLPDGRAASLVGIQVIARLQPGVSPEALARVLATAPTAGGPSLQVQIEPLTGHMRSAVRPVALAALLAVLCVLGACAANLANLFLVRTDERAVDLAIRAALGASRLDLARLIVADIAVLGMAGTAIGLLLAHGALATVRTVVPPQYTLLGELAVSGRVALFAGAVGAVTLLMAVVPSLARSSFTAVVRPLRGTLSSNGAIPLMRLTMIAAQSATAMVLMVGASLLVRSYLHLSTQDVGFSGDVVVASVSHDSERSETLEQNIAALIERVRHTPGVVTSAAAIGSMVDSHRMMAAFRIEGHARAVHLKYVTADYFDAVGAAIVLGRALSAGDRGWDAVVINRTMARHMWPDSEVIGRIISSTDGSVQAMIVGVVQDTFDLGYDERPEPMLFAPLSLRTARALPEEVPVHYFVRLNQWRQGSESILTRAIAETVPEGVIVDVSTIDERFRGSVKDRILAMLVLGIFAIAAAAICAAGVVGIVRFSVVRRTREIAIRLALGATRASVGHLVVRQTLTASIAGLAAGAVAGQWLSASLERFVYGVQPGDWSTLAAGAAVLLGLVLGACWVPAVRVTKIPPALALRFE